LDGARLFNAVVASGVSLDRWAAQFDSVSVCFSKGLGAPVGSALAGTAEFVKRARRARKLFGGGMRQAGIIAAGALYALEHHRDRLAEDHLAAQRLAAVAAEVGGVWLEPERVDSNIVMLRIAPQLGSAAEMVAWLAEHGVQVLPFGPQYLRLVTHLDVNARQIDRACQVLSDCFDHFSHRSCRPATC
jgi:threonine aldolase